MKYVYMNVYTDNQGQIKGFYSNAKRCGLPLPWGHDSENDGRSSIGGIFSNSLIKREA